MSRSPDVGLHVATGARRATAAAIVASGSRLPPVRAVEKQLGLSKIESLGNELVGMQLDPFGGIDLASTWVHSRRTSRGRGVHVSNASATFLGAPHLHGFRISYAYLSELEMRSALTILATRFARSLVEFACAITTDRRSK